MFRSCDTADLGLCNQRTIYPDSVCMVVTSFGERVMWGGIDKKRYNR